MLRSLATVRRCSSLHFRLTVRHVLNELLFLLLCLRGALLLCKNGQVLRLGLLRLDIIGFQGNPAVDGIDLRN